MTRILRVRIVSGALRPMSALYSASCRRSFSLVNVRLSILALFGGGWEMDPAASRVRFPCDACNLPHLVPESLPSRKFPSHIHLILEVHFRCEAGYKEIVHQ
jgi:hypothetical protein